MSSTGDRDRGHAYAALDGWRGICAVLVAVFHLHTISHFEGLAVVRNAHLFVDFFFVLSGFVVTFAYLGRLSTGGEVGIMVWRRFARLWPLHVVMLALFILFELGSELASLLAGLSRSTGLFEQSSANRLSAIPTNLLLIHSLGVHDRLTWNIPSWSISAEFWTYIVFAVSVRLAGKRSIYMAILFACFAVVVLIASKTRLSDAQHDFGFFRCLYGFFVGYLVYMALRATPERLSRLIGTTVEVLAALGVVTFVSLFGMSKVSFAAPLVFGIAVWVFAHGGGRLSDILRSKPLAKLGLWSYSIYMVHALVVAVLNKLVTVASAKLGVPLIEMVPLYDEVYPTISFGGPWVMDALVLGYIALVIGLSVLTWRYVEMPIQRWLNARLQQPPGQTSLVWVAPSRFRSKPVAGVVPSPERAG